MLRTMSQLADLYFAGCQFEEVEKVQMRILVTIRRVFGEEHPDTLTSMENVPMCYYYRGFQRQSEGLHLQTLEIKRRVLGKERPGTLITMRNLGVAYTMQSRAMEAE